MGVEEVYQGLGSVPYKHKGFLASEVEHHDPLTGRKVEPRFLRPWL
jgi:hypothetical protein